MPMTVSPALRKSLLIGLPLLLVFGILLPMWWLNHEPPLFQPDDRIAAHAADHGHAVTVGYTTTATLIEVIDTLLTKRGGYMSNDVMPPWVLLDNVPNWEFGALTQVRDLARTMRNDFSRSQTQSTEDPALASADPLLHYDHARWLLPSTQGKYEEAMVELENYLTRLSDPRQPNAQFYARADNLVDWLGLVEKRLGSLSQRLSASVGQQRINTDLSNDPDARQSTAAADEVRVKTPWLEIDDVFYETRGSTWALILFLRAMETDFRQVLEDKNAMASYRQIIRELEATQEPLNSFMVLNGSQFGVWANHSLVMANYVARANAAIIDLRRLLQQG